MPLLLRKYIRMLFESPEQDSNLEPIPTQGNSLSQLENKYSEEIAAGNKMQSPHTGWSQLDTLITDLTQISKTQAKTEVFKDIQNYLTQENFKMIGQGIFRNVYSKPNFPFVIKVQSNTRREANQIEYEKYFSYEGEEFDGGQEGQLSEKKYSLFPKIYAYDQINKAWIIFEKVNVFRNDKEATDEMAVTPIIFSRYKQQIEKIFQAIKRDPFLKSQIVPDNIEIYFQPNGEINTPKIFGPNFFENFINSIAQPVNYEETDRNNRLTKQGPLSPVSRNQNTEAAYLENLFSQINVWCFMDMWNYNPERDEQIKAKTLELFKQIGIRMPPDIKYFYEYFFRGKGGLIRDLHAGNIGYRDLKNNPDEPWKNLVIIDFGEN